MHPKSGCFALQIAFYSSANVVHLLRITGIEIGKVIE
jgi:hypothetical protein